MNFVSYEFAALMLIVLVGVTVVRGRSSQHVFLLAASYGFYAWWSPYFLLLLLGSTVLDYWAARRIASAPTRGSRGGFLLLSLFFNLGVLAVFKYSAFAIDGLQSFFDLVGAGVALPAPTIDTSFLGRPGQFALRDVLYPVGLSFYTFQTVSYSIDVYRGARAPHDSLREFALYVCFFPQLVAGPIVRSSEFLPQLREPIHLSGASFRVGAALIMWGLVKKVGIGDNLSFYIVENFRPIANAGVIDCDTGEILFTGLAASIQLYCDFSGYTDIAIGSAAILGIHLPINFRAPLLVGSWIEFWRSWHISLARWFRDYVFHPLGTSSGKLPRTLLNMMIVMVLVGLWHGADWNFVLLGIYWGLGQVVNTVWRAACRGRLKAPSNVVLRTLLRFGSVVLTQYCMCFAFGLFHVRGLTNARVLARAWWTWPNLFEDGVQWADQEHLWWGMFIVLFYAAHLTSHLLGARLGKRLPQAWASAGIGPWAALMAIGTLLLLVLWPAERLDFIYYEF